MYDFDVLVLGSGPGGQKAAIAAAKLGRRVAVVERRNMIGGVCINTGTIPSKTLRETVLNLSGWRERGFYGLAYRVKKDIEGKDLCARLRMTLDHEIEVLEHQFARNGVKTFGGSARLNENWRLFGSGTYDLTRDVMTSDGLGFAYSDECFTYLMTFSETRNRDTQEVSQNIGFNLSFRTLGDFGSSTNQLMEN